MKRYVPFLTGVLLLLYSCKPNDDQKQNNKIPNRESDLAVESVSSEDLYFESDSLTEFLSSQLNKIATDSKFKIEKTLTENRHVDNLKDTVIERTFENIKLTSYKGIGYEAVIEASIENSDFKLNNYIQVGTSKKVVEKSLGIVIPNEILKIVNFEQTTQFGLKFENGYLKKIEFEGYLD